LDKIGYLVLSRRTTWQCSALQRKCAA